jgi:hypothetical protein
MGNAHCETTRLREWTRLRIGDGQDNDERLHQTRRVRDDSIASTPCYNRMLASSEAVGELLGTIAPLACACSGAGVDLVGNLRDPVGYRLERRQEKHWDKDQKEWCCGLSG